MIVAGLGYRRGVTVEAILEVLSAALAANGIAQAQLGALAIPEEKDTESGIRDAARALSLPVITISSDAMQSAGAGALTVSARVQALKGVPSVAEAAALAAAGAGARLLAPRTTTPTVTCALATGDAP